MQPYCHSEADHEQPAAGPAICDSPDARSPGFAATAVFTLALGIAADVIVFGALQAILRPIDVPNANQVMTLAHQDQDYPIFSYPEVRDVRDGNSVFSAVAAVDITNFGES